MKRYFAPATAELDMLAVTFLLQTSGSTLPPLDDPNIKPGDNIHDI